MNRTHPISRYLATLMFLVLAQGAAQESRRLGSRPIPPASTGALVALGEQLFHDKRLSSTVTMSCASCHRPDLAFTDGTRSAVGQNGTGLGRNTPTLYGVSSDAAFPLGGSLGSLAASVDLHDRVLAPLRNAAEMNDSVERAILHLNLDKDLGSRFNAVFAPDDGMGSPEGATPARLASALAAYVGSLSPPSSPGMRALQGQDALSSDAERRGLEVFRGAGRCTTCHAGPGLTDGRSHVVSTFRQQRRILSAAETVEAGDEGPTSRPDLIIVAMGPIVMDLRPTSDSPEARVFEIDILSPGTRRYGSAARVSHVDFESIERQTTSLIEVRRTAPYFRDGSVARLDQAVRRHVFELREVGRMRVAVLANPEALLAGVDLRATVALTDSAKEQLSTDTWIPAKLNAAQLDDLVAFLGSLSGT